MKTKLIALGLIVCAAFGCKPKIDGYSYAIITPDTINVNSIDTNLIKDLDEPLRAVAAFYSAKFGTGGDLNNNGLTIALGLDSQGSAKHKELVSKYFKGDKEVDTLLTQDFFVPPGAATRTNYITSLLLTRIGDTIKTDYLFDYIDHMEPTHYTGKDVFVFDGKIFRRVGQ